MSQLTLRWVTGQYSRAVQAKSFLVDGTCVVCLFLETPLEIRHKLRMSDKGLIQRRATVAINNF